MLRAILLVALIFLINIISEYLWRKKKLRGEGGRKFIHILSGIWIAAWPYMISYQHIQLLGVLLLIGVAASQRFNLFHAIHDKQIDRWTIGEIFYPVAIIACALLEPPHWVFSTAILFLGVADGLAAVVGTRYRKIAREYRVFGQRKTVLGTGVYVLSALTCAFLMFWFLSPDASFYFSDYRVALILVAITAASLENLLPYGTDNLVVPLLVVVLLP